MQLSIDFLIRATQAGTAEASLQDHAVRRLSFALRRFHDQIRHVSVRVVDVNGPRGGVDARCSMTADLVNGPRLFVEATSPWPSAAITQAASRIGAAVRRANHRQTTRRIGDPAAARNARNDQSLVI